jgi:Protein of unknown function (DUF2933)
MEHDHQGENRKAWFSSRSNLVLVAFLGIAGFYLITEHRAHVFGVLPFLILLACPLMHVFMHRGHGGHGDESGPAGHDHGNKTGEKR